MRKCTVSDFIYGLGQFLFACFAVSFVLFIVGLFVYGAIREVLR